MINAHDCPKTGEVHFLLGNEPCGFCGEVFGSSKPKNVRLSFEEYGCLIALTAKSRAEDFHTKIGGVALSSSGRVLGTAYNGLKSGKSVPEWMNKQENRKKKGDFFIHCESNLCSQLKRDECHTICLTQSPCIKCCQNIAALNIKKVVYLQEYKKCDGFKDFFSFHEIEYKELSQESKNRIKDYLTNTNNFFELD